MLFHVWFPSGFGGRNAKRPQDKPLACYFWSRTGIWPAPQKGLDVLRDSQASPRARGSSAVSGRQLLRLCFLGYWACATFPSKSVQHKGFPNTELGQLTATSVRRTWKALPKMLTKGVQILAVLNCLRVYSSPCMFLLKSQTNILIHEKGSLSEKKKKAFLQTCANQCKFHGVQKKEECVMMLVTFVSLRAFFRLLYTAAKSLSLSIFSYPDKVASLRD